MNNKFPLLYPDLVNHFKAIQGCTDDPDETDYEWSEGNLNFIKNPIIILDNF